MDGVDWAPGTVTLEDRLQSSSSTIILQPTPTEDPNDPLNWSKWRKAVNFTLACFYSLFTFTLLDIGPVVWGDLNTELNISFSNLNNSFAANTAGLAVGSIFLLPVAHKYGRRPMYLLSLTLMFAGTIWAAEMNTNWENITVNLILGLFGAVSEAVVQMTIADIFFVHQRATANAIYLLMVTIGTFLAPVAAGYSAASQGWRWIYWWTAIFLGINLVAVIFFFEETKYVVNLTGHERRGSVTEKVTFHDKKEETELTTTVTPSSEPAPLFKKKTYGQRLKLLTTTEQPVLRHTYQPFIILFTFPAVTYASIMYGGWLAWFSVISITSSTYLLSEPYNFGAAGVGLFSLAPFIGSVVATAVAGPMTDWYILKMAKRNNGIFEPEMRLHMALPAVIIAPIGILMYGLCLAKGYAWILLAVGYALYGFGFTVIGDVSLTYLIDCYQDITGDSLVAVAFVRNAIATGLVFAIVPWINGVGLYTMFSTIGGIALALFLLTVPMILFGKKARKMTAARYRKYAMLQPSTRAFEG